MSLSNNSTLPQSVEMVDAVGSCKKDNTEEVNQLSRKDNKSNQNFCKAGHKEHLLDCDYCAIKDAEEAAKEGKDCKKCGYRLGSYYSAHGIECFTCWDANRDSNRGACQ